MTKKLILTDVVKVLKESKCDRNLTFQKIEGSESMEFIEEHTPYPTLIQNISPLLNGIGVDTKELTAKEILIKLLNLVPFVQGNTHMWQYGRPALGKTFLLAKVLAPSSKAISGKITGAQLFGDMKKGDKGLIGEHEVIGFEDIQSFNMSTEEKGSIFDYLTTGETRIKNIGSDESYSTSLIFNGNFDDEVEKSLQENPYTNVRELLSTSFPEGFNQSNFKTRVICIPTWISRNSKFINNEKAIGYQINFLLEEFKRLKKLKPNISYKLNLENSRSEDNLKKVVTGLYKLLNFSQLVLDQEEITTKSDIEALELIGKKIIELPFTNSNFTLVGTQEVNQLWIKLSEHLMKYPLTSITEAYVNEHRITIRFKEEKDSLYKIALDNIGIEQNKAEVKIYQDVDEIHKDSFIPIYSYHKDYLVVVAKTENSPFSSYQQLNNVENLFQKRLSLDSLHIDNNKLVEYLKDREESQKKEIENLRSHLKILNDFIIDRFSQHERMAINNAPLTFKEKELLTIKLTNYLSEVFSLQLDTFKNYHFVLNEKERKTYLLHYYYLNPPYFNDSYI